MMRAAFSDWRLVGGFRATTGPWLTILTGSDIALNGQAGTQRANQVLDDPYADKSINPANGGMRFLNPAAFAQPAAGSLGTSARNSIRGMGTRNLDMSLTRVIRLNSTRAFEVRVDAFNAFNWFQWLQPATSLNNLATFGQITYRLSCAVCHGASGRGDGELASSLAVPAPDLTSLPLHQLMQRHGSGRLVTAYTNRLIPMRSAASCSAMGS